MTARLQIITIITYAVAYPLAAIEQSTINVIVTASKAQLAIMNNIMSSVAHIIEATENAVFIAYTKYNICMLAIVKVKYRSSSSSLHIFLALYTY